MKKEKKKKQRSATFNYGFVLQVWFLSSQRSELELHLKSGGKAPVLSREIVNRRPASATATHTFEAAVVVPSFAKVRVS